MATTPSTLAGPAPGETPEVNRNPSSASPSMLAGMSNSDMATSKPDTDNGLKQVTQQVRDMQSSMTALAKQFPAAAPSFRAAGVALRSAMRQIIANPSSPEPAAPAIGG